MIGHNFLKRLVDRTLDASTRSDLSIKPAITPDLLSDKFQGFANAAAQSNSLMWNPLTARHSSSNAKLLTGRDLSNSQIPSRKDPTTTTTTTTTTADKKISKESPNIISDSAKIEPMETGIIHSPSDNTDEEGEQIDAAASNVDVSEHRIQPIVYPLNDAANLSKNRSPSEHELDPNRLIDTEKRSYKEDTKFNIHLSVPSNSETSSNAHLRIKNNDNNDNVVARAPIHDKTSNLSKLPDDDPRNIREILQPDAIPFSSNKIISKVQQEKTEVISHANKKEEFVSEDFQQIRRIQPDESQGNDSVNYLNYLEPTVTVNIGRIEVKAVLPAINTTNSSGTIGPSATFVPTLSLKEYLKQRAEGKNI